MSNEPLLTDDDIDEIASGYTGNPRDVGIFTGIEVRNRYEAELNSLRADTIPEPVRDLIAKLYGANEQLRAETSDMIAKLYGQNEQLRIRLAQLEAEAERNRGDHK